MLQSRADATFAPSSASDIQGGKMRSRYKFPEPVKNVFSKGSGKSLTKMKGHNLQQQETQMRICSPIYIAKRKCCVARILCISKTAKLRPDKLRKTWALSSGICAWLVAAIFLVSASLAGAQTWSSRCPSGATGCSGPVSDWDTSKVTSMRSGKSKYFMFKSTFVYSTRSQLLVSSSFEPRVVHPRNSLPSNAHQVL